MTNIAFGRYTPYNSFTHKLDPRNKIFMMILLLVSIFLKVNSWSSTLIMSAFLLITFIIMMIVSKISFIELFKSLKAMWLLILFLLIIYILIPNPNYSLPAFSIGSLTIYYDSFYQSFYIVLRIMMMLMVTMILTSTTSPMNLTYGLEWYMTPLKLIKFPAHIVAMTLSIALRFIPTLIDETERIIKAQSSRGVDFEHGGLLKKIGAIISLIIPLFVSSINRSEELSNAMEARGYDPYLKRSRYRILSFSYRDLIALIIVLLLFGAILTLRIIDGVEGLGPVDIIYWIFAKKPLF